LEPIWYENATGPKTTITAEHFLDQPFYIRLTLEGEERIASNQHCQERKKNGSIDNLKIESRYLEDLNSDFVSTIISKETRKHELQNLKLALKNLTENQRKAVLKYYIGKQTYQQIADELGCSKQTVHESVKKSLEKMKKYIMDG